VEPSPAAADQSAPILEHDPSTEAVIEPTGKHSSPRLPEHCVLCFFHDVIATLAADGTATKTTDLRSEMGLLPSGSPEAPRQIGSGRDRDEAAASAAGDGAEDAAPEAAEEPPIREAELLEEFDKLQRGGARA